MIGWGVLFSSIDRFVVFVLAAGSQREHPKEKARKGKILLRLAVEGTEVSLVGVSGMFSVG